MNSKETILIVDDTQTNIDILIELLNDEYDIVVALDGQSAIETLDYDNNVDLILLDIMMPNMDGFEVCQKLKENEKTSDIPVIFLTAKSDDHSIQKGFELGGVDYVTKPFRPMELLARVKTHLSLQKHKKNEIQNSKFIAIGHLMENIAHQWRQPLSVISTSATGMMLQKDLSVLTDENFKTFCESIATQTQYLSSTIEELKYLLHLGVEDSIFNLNDVLNQQKAFFISQSLLHGVNLEINIDESINIKGSKSKFIKVILILLMNSKEAFETNNIENKKIFIEAFKKDEKVIIEFVDNAGGIEQSVMGNIFDPYFTTHYKSLGKGLGLYIARTLIVDSFDGSIGVTNIEFVDSGKKQKGARFEINLPCH